MHLKQFQTVFQKMFKTKSTFWRPKAAKAAQALSRRKLWWKLRHRLQLPNAPWQRKIINRVRTNRIYVFFFSNWYLYNNAFSSIFRVFCFQYTIVYSLLANQFSCFSIFIGFFKTTCHISLILVDQRCWIDPGANGWKNKFMVRPAPPRQPRQSATCTFRVPACLGLRCYQKDVTN